MAAQPAAVMCSIEPSRPPGPALRLDESAPDGVPRELDTIVHAELLQDVRAVALHRLLADDEPVGDLLGAIALGDQLDDFLLAVVSGSSRNG